jgi:hypothetical protein
MDPLTEWLLAGEPPTVDPPSGATVGAPIGGLGHRPYRGRLSGPNDYIPASSAALIGNREVDLHRPRPALGNPTSSRMDRIGGVALHRR